MKNNPLPRLDASSELRELLLPHCRLRAGDVWQDETSGHRVGCMDAACQESITDLLGDDLATLAIHDPPYNLAAFERRSIEEYIAWCSDWISTTRKAIAPDASLYVWIGADQNDGFQPLPDFMLMMRDEAFRARSLITMRN